MQDLCRVVIEGKTASAVQGTGLRDAIQEIADNLGAKGQIRNIKGESKVEVICEKVHCVRLKEEILRLDSTQENVFKIKKVDIKEDLFDEFTGFDVVREDDLSEMVWGLQAAGKVFAITEEKREFTRNRSLFKGLELCINSISIHLDQIQSNEKRSPMHLFAVEHFLEEPPGNVDDTLLRKLWDLYTLCKNINAGIENRIKVDDPLLQDYIKRLRELLIEVAAETRDLYSGIK